MPSKTRRYQLKTDDVEQTKTWIENQLIAKGCLSGSPLTQFKRIRSSAKTLQGWCDRHLLPDQWRRLQAAIRSRRRKASAGVHVRLSSDAYLMLQTCAKRDGVTLSEAVLRLAIPPPPPQPHVERARLVKYTNDMALI